MKDQADVLVIGAGVVGVCSAYYLARQGLRVTVLERESIAAGSSYGNAGLIVTSYRFPMPRPGVMSRGLAWMLDPEGPVYIKPRADRALLSWLWKFWRATAPAQVKRGMQALSNLGAETIGLFERLIEGEALECDYQQVGNLMVYRTEHGFQEGIEEAHLLRDAGVNLNILDSAEARQIEPGLRPEVVGAVFMSDDAHINPAGFVQELAHRFQASGGRIESGAEVVGFRTVGRTVTTVRTTRGDYSAGHVVLAAGAWAPTTVGDLPLKLHIQPAKGYSLTFPHPEDGPRIPIRLEEAYVVLTPIGSSLRYAGTLEFAGLDFSTNRRRVNAIARAPAGYLSRNVGGSGSPVVWCGLRPVTPDSLPMIGAAPTLDNLVVATGHGMLGLTFGPITGILVTQLVCGQNPQVDLEPLRVDRF